MKDRLECINSIVMNKNRKLALEFLNDIVKVDSNTYNTNLYYRFRSFQLSDYVAIKTGNDLYALDWDLAKIRKAVFYHIKKIGFVKSNMPNEYKCLK